MTHADLVQKASKWLRNKLNCRVALEELTALTLTGEIPDVIGWVHERSILIEVKTSLSDFKADAKKIFRREPEIGLGHWRFYFSLPGIIPDELLPAGWGLYELHGRSVKYIGGVEYANAARPPFDSNLECERLLLLSALARADL